jgi:pSer/pThr/pTyr-binding forkhead associated (FHA) protein
LGDRKYYLRDLGDGNGTFIKIQSELQLKNGYIISFGDSHMSVSFFQERNSRLMERIQLKFIAGPKQDQSFEFTGSEVVTIGRMP